jgi:hypothetical protein
VKLLFLLFGYSWLRARPISLRKNERFETQPTAEKRSALKLTSSKPCALKGYGFSRAVTARSESGFSR